MTGILQLIGVFAAVFLIPVTGINLSFTKSRVVMGVAGETVLTCAVDEVDVDILYVVQVKGYYNSAWVQLAKLDSTGKTSTLPASFTNRITVDGSYDATTPQNSQLRLTFDTQNLVCTDSTEYRCEISYLTNDQTNPQSVNSAENGTLTAYVRPSITQPLEGRRNGNIVQGSSSSSEAAFNIGDELQLSCTANIGSVQTTKIEWRKTSEIDSYDTMIQYPPPTGTSTEGTTTTDGNCGYTRTATIRYNTTAADANRKNNLAFECYVRVTGDPYNNFETTNNPMFYAEVSGGTTQAPGAATAGSGNVGAIAGGVVGGLVFIVIVVLLVYFLWYRRRSAGEDYKTKEEYGAENPNMAPPSDTYASVDKTDKKKKKNGDPGYGSEEPLKPRPKPRAGQQELHYAELDLTKNPPVAPRKKRNEPVEYAEVQFHK